MFALIIVSLGLAACGDEDEAEPAFTVVAAPPPEEAPPMTLRAPSYWLINGTPVRVTLNADGIRIAERLDPRTRVWEERATLFAEILHGEWVDEVSEAEFRAAVDEITGEGGEP